MFLKECDCKCIGQAQKCGGLKPVNEISTSNCMILYIYMGVKENYQHVDNTNRLYIPNNVFSYEISLSHGLDII